MHWIAANKEWLFSGAGIFIISIIGALIFKSKATNKQIQKSGANSKNLQAGGEIRIDINHDK